MRILRRVFEAALFVLFLSSAGSAERIRISTDLHLSQAGREQQDAFQMLLEQPCDVLILLGDLANSGHLREHQMVVDGLAKMDAEILVLPGNHDLTAETPPEQFQKIYASFGYDQAFARDPDSLSYAVMTEEGICLLMLDTNAWDPVRQMVQHGGIASHLAEWTAGVLEPLPEGTPVIAFGHYPLSADGANDTAGGAELLQALSEGNVLAYFCGHRHSNGTFVSGNLRQIMVGVPWSYPPLVRTIERREAGFRSGTELIYPEGSDGLRTMRKQSTDLARRMAEGSLAGTDYEGNQEAVMFFEAFFDATVNGRLEEVRNVLMTREGYRMWQDADVKTAVKPWLLSAMEDSREDYHEIVLGE